MRRLGLILLAAAFFVAPLEVGLRLFPEVIPLAFLKEFEPSLRSRIASQRNLQREEDTVIVPRDDGGPADLMWLYRGGARITQAFDEPGIVATVQMDEMGFCNERPDAYEVSRIDVAALGDSFTWCTNVEPRDTWPAKLEWYTGLGTYNFGIPGRGLYEHVQILKRYGLSKSPRFVVLGVYEGNDLRDAVRFHAASSEDAAALVDARCPFGSPDVCRFYERVRGSLPARHSYAFNLAWAGLWRLAQSLQKSEINFRYDVELSDGAVLDFNSRNSDRDEVEFARRLADGRVRLGLFDDALQAFVELSRRHDFVPIVVYIPSAYSAYWNMARFDDQAIAADLLSYSDAQREYFARQGKELGYAYVDMTPILRARAAERGEANRLYFRTNVHLTQRGHDVVAEAVAKVIEEIRSGGGAKIGEQLARSD